MKTKSIFQFTSHAGRESCSKVINPIGRFDQKNLMSLERDLLMNHTH